MTRQQRDAMKALGIETEMYYSAQDPNPASVNDWVGATWGLALMKDGKDLRVIESHAHQEGPTRFWIRNERTEDKKTPTDWSRPYTLQRLAIAAALKEIFALS